MRRPMEMSVLGVCERSDIVAVTNLPSIRGSLPQRVWGVERTERMLDGSGEVSRSVAKGYIGSGRLGGEELVHVQGSEHMPV